MNGICKLCRSERDLHNRSHAVPYWVEKAIRGTNPAGKVHRMVRDDGEVTVSSVVKGIGYDQFYYCKSCEDWFAKLDEYGEAVIKNRKKTRAVLSRAQRSLRGIGSVWRWSHKKNAWKFGAWYLSVLYRLHLSEHEHYWDYHLPDSWIERTRSFLNGRKHSSEFDSWYFGIVGMSERDFAFLDTISMPYNKSIENAHYVEWRVGGWTILAMDRSALQMSTDRHWERLECDADSFCMLYLEGKELRQYLARHQSDLHRWFLH